MPTVETLVNDRAGEPVDRPAIRRTRPVSLSETRADPSGRNASPHGLVRDRATVFLDTRSTVGWALAAGNNGPKARTPPIDNAPTMTRTAEVIVMKRARGPICIQPVCVTARHLSCSGHKPDASRMTSAKAAAPELVRCTPSETK